MPKARIGVKELHPPQRHRVPSRLKVMWSGQGGHRLKMIFHLDKVEMVSLPLLVKIRSRYWSHQILDATAVGFPVISTIHFIASAANVEAH